LLLVNHLLVLLLPFLLLLLLYLVLLLILSLHYHREVPLSPPISCAIRGVHSFYTAAFKQFALERETGSDEINQMNLRGRIISIRRCYHLGCDTY
jgi:hypothetical protein